MRQQLLRGVRFVTREEMLISDTAESACAWTRSAPCASSPRARAGCSSAPNDVRAGIARAVGHLRGYYEIAYSPTNRAFDGKFRKITLKVGRPGVAVQTRSGYFAMPPGEGTATFPYEVRLLEAMRSRSPRATSRSTPARSASGGSRAAALHPGARAPAQRIKLESDRDPALKRAHFSFMGVLRTSWGAVAEKFSQDSPVWLPRSKHAELMQGMPSSCARSPFPRAATASRRRLSTSSRGG